MTEVIVIIIHTTADVACRYEAQNVASGNEALCYIATTEWVIQ